MALLDRLDWVRGVEIARERTARVHSAQLARLVEEGGIMTVRSILNVGHVVGPDEDASIIGLQNVVVRYKAALLAL